jgi:hypothetical protein
MPGDLVCRCAWDRGGGYASAWLLAGADVAADTLADFFGNGGEKAFT